MSGEENEMGVFRHTLTVMNRNTQSSRRAIQEERLRLNNISIEFIFIEFLENNRLFC